jgi:hypothetical protein
VRQSRLAQDLVRAVDFFLKVDDLRAQASQLAGPAVVVLTLRHAERAMGARVERRHAQQ